MNDTLVDSHCHLDLLNLDSYQGDLGAVIEKAKSYGVEYILCPGVNLKTADKVISIAERFDNVYAAVGLHPGDVDAEDPSEADFLAIANHPRVVAIGETGLDYSYPNINIEKQKKIFINQINIAKKLSKPLIIHTRDAEDDTLSIMKQEKAHEVGGVMHCFTGSSLMAIEVMKMMFYIGFSGIVTFKNGRNVRNIAKIIPLNRMLVETDAPWLAPVPFRGKMNEPQYVRFVAQHLAELKGKPVGEIARITTRNFFRLFLGGNNNGYIKDMESG